MEPPFTESVLNAIETAKDTIAHLNIDTSNSEFLVEESLHYYCVSYLFPPQIDSTIIGKVIRISIQCDFRLLDVYVSKRKSRIAAVYKTFEVETK